MDSTHESAAIHWGDATITPVVDWGGEVDQAGWLLPDTDRADWERHRSLLTSVGALDPATDRRALSVHSWLLRVDGLARLVDTGAGNGKDLPGLPLFADLTTPISTASHAQASPHRTSIWWSTPTCTPTTPVECWLAVPGAPTNCGLPDVIAALRWIRDETPAFGGDPRARHRRGPVRRSDDRLRSPRVAVGEGAVHPRHQRQRQRRQRDRTRYGRTRHRGGNRLRGREGRREAFVRGLGRAPGRRSPPHRCDRLRIPRPTPVDAHSFRVGPGPGEPCRGNRSRQWPQALHSPRIYSSATRRKSRTSTWCRQAGSAPLARRTSPPEPHPTPCSSMPPTALPTPTPGQASTFAYEFAWRSNAFDGRLGACHCVDPPGCSARPTCPR